ncbi:hypothetical protein SKAU_G00129280 [Synaphobranchus kaupii]|uniref:Uncharacterized protein n=1 Tax=Synaphobranchus kaupii TaxID=118154 RepID=A0A9Q1J116_SYNKA|nr:hypothetical protein SKAU_G00129280 [Synaphobranchus kaupii]
MGELLELEDELQSEDELLENLLAAERPGKGQCGTTAWAAAREASQKTSSRTDEEGIEIAVCRDGFLLRGLNMFWGEVFAYPLYLQKDLAKQHNISFFCTDQMCRYWPYLERVVGQFKDLGNLLSMKPVLCSPCQGPHN